MLFEGTKLMLVGMTTVLLFLSFMILILQLVSKLTRNITRKEFEQLERTKKLRQKEYKQQKENENLVEDDQEHLAVIAAAIAAFEAEKSIA